MSKTSSIERDIAQIATNLAVAGHTDLAGQLLATGASSPQKADAMNKLLTKFRQKTEYISFQRDADQALDSLENDPDDTLGQAEKTLKLMKQDFENMIAEIDKVLGMK